jgi:hypothetical protein
MTIKSMTGFARRTGYGETRFHWEARVNGRARASPRLPPVLKAEIKARALCREAQPGYCTINLTIKRETGQPGSAQQAALRRPWPLPNAYVKSPSGNM